MSDSAKYFKALQLGLEIYTDQQEIQQLHDEPRFNEIKKDVEEILTTFQLAFLSSDPLAKAFFGAVIAGIDVIKYDDVKPKPAPAPKPVPAPVPPAPVPVPPPAPTAVYDTFFDTPLPSDADLIKQGYVAFNDAVWKNGESWAVAHVGGFLSAGGLDHVIKA